MSPYEYFVRRTAEQLGFDGAWTAPLETLEPDVLSAILQDRVCSTIQDIERRLWFIRDLCERWGEHDLCAHVALAMKHRRH